MTRRVFLPAALLALATATSVVAAALPVKWPPWLSIESPVNPFDPSTRGAVLLAHATFREGQSQLSDLSGTAEGIVNGARRSITLRFDTTGRPSVFALRRQWPTEGTWLLRIALKQTTAIVTLDQNGGVASVRVPTQLAGGNQIPRIVGAREIDSTLAEAAKR
jgi:opacity protein-like surface antigen